MFRKNMRFRLFVCFFALPLLLSACQPTPEDAIVSQKGDLTDKIAETAAPGQAPTGVGSHYSLEKTFEQSGHTLIVDADITGGDESKMAVLTVAEKPFESGNSLKKVVDIFFPDYKAYEYNEFTKDDLQQQIDQAQLMIFRLKNGLNTLTGEPLKENVCSICASFTAWLPASCAYARRSGLVAGIRALPGRARPSASAMICIVDAVPINEQAPQLGQALHFAQSSSSRRLTALKFCAVHAKLLQCQHLRSRIHRSARHNNRRNIDTRKADQIAQVLIRGTFLEGLTLAIRNSTK